MKAARKVGHRRQLVRCGHPAAIPPQSRRASDPARCGDARAVSGQWRGSGGADARTGADVPTLTGPGFVLTSGAQVAPTCGAEARGPRRASEARAPAPVGAMEVLVLRSRSSRCQRLGAERPPLHALTRRRPGTLSPHKAVAPATAGAPKAATPTPSSPAATRRASRPSSPHMSQVPAVQRLLRPRPSSTAPQRAPCQPVDAAHGPAGGHAACPHQEQPPPRLSAEDTARANRPSKGPRPQSIKGGSSNSLGKGALARKQLLFYPPASFKRRQKNTKQSYTGGLIIRHVCSPRPPSSSTPRPRNPPPLGRRASDRQRPPAT